jgi:hypothetical protein
MSSETKCRSEYLMDCDSYLRMIDRIIQKLNELTNLEVDQEIVDLVIGSVIIWSVYELMLIEVEHVGAHGRDSYGNGYPSIVSKKIDNSHAIIPCGCKGGIIIDRSRRINIHNMRPKDDVEPYAYFGFDGSPTKKLVEFKPTELFKNLMAIYIPPQYLNKSYQ